MTQRRTSRFTRQLVTLVLTIMLVPVVSAAAAAQGARLKLPDFSQLASKASESVDISLDPSLLGLAARFMSADDEDEKAVKEMIGSLQGVYVKSFEFDTPNGYSKADVDAVRQQLSGPGWTRLVGVKSRRESTDVDIFVWMNGDKPGGLALVSAEPKELTIINIIGMIDLDRLQRLEGKFGIPRLDLERRGKPRGKDEQNEQDDQQQEQQQDQDRQDQPDQQVKE